MGRLIPAGTGMEYYRNVDIERDETIDQASERELDEFPDIVGGHDIPNLPHSWTSLLSGDEWLHELKFDGYRLLCHLKVVRFGFGPGTRKTGRRSFRA
jgi:hypothetical protein